MRKGLVSAYQEGTLSVYTEMLRITEEVTNKEGVDIEGLFYAAAFQAGVDRFVLHARSDRPAAGLESKFLKDRLVVLDDEASRIRWKRVNDTFQSYLPDDLRIDEKYVPVSAWMAFISELLDAMDSGACCLSISGVPDAAEIQSVVPDELFVPLNNLASAFQPIAAPSTVPTTAISREQLDRYRTILESDLFARYVASETGLEDGTSDLPAVLSDLLERARALVRNNPKVLSVRRSSIGLLNFTPKIVDALLGKLPGAIAEMAANLGDSYLEDRRRIVVYDFGNIMLHGTLSYVARMFHESEGSAQTEEKPTS